MTTTDAYRSWLAAHPDLAALDDAEKDHEAALAMGETPGLMEDGRLHIGRDLTWRLWSPTTDASQAVEFAQATADATERNVYAIIGWGGAPASANAGQYERAEAPTFPAALTTACLAARRAMMERDDDD